MATFIIDNSSISEYVFVTNVGIKAADLEPRKEFGSDNLKLTPEGKKQYRLRVTALILDEEGNPVREDNGFSVSVTNPVDLKRGVDYVLTGKVRITPYVDSSNRQAFSVLADGIAPAPASK